MKNSFPEPGKISFMSKDRQSDGLGRNISVAVLTRTKLNKNRMMEKKWTLFNHGLTIVNTGWLRMAGLL